MDGKDITTEKENPITVDDSSILFGKNMSDFFTGRLLDFCLFVAK